MSVCKFRGSNFNGNDRLRTERWEHYFYETLNIHDDVEMREGVIYQGPEEQIEPPTKNEVWEIIRTLKNNKSLGADSISAELIKNIDKILWEDIHTLIDLYVHYIRKERNYNIAIIEESAY